MHVVLVIDDGKEVVVGHLEAGEADMPLVDALARLQLSARRSGCAMSLRDVSGDLRSLLELAGLGGVLGLEAAGEPELGEQLGVEEVVEPGDPTV